ncbi:aldehyde dehydrogenase family protein [Ponticoccus sp. SC2-23]|uniref:aldehyde dehydrogenase family protein n=1 Tax=Alexandriicola marinus TaxID=2081710 RepID=UPI000FD926F2|nr:aldehyde dehydrogenase family protein [Alexandriicola marinus]MBM1219210.1 aldehyde dehydrogenase family protein [Ponticoccus sp. SC6-9]MBM1223718.1 aldehyde dehydrogenase family protein [Ponticoccus sp. SC6-15]MBM1229023.1 aldehyde dehydrogenase family protein [Ponticoccus sp. SC6-38]MBM1232684.1 aldehyde dehydrogenase family protein [Ponticoccus sp. SC6-45]MBM1237366.1 aldehyde dehydrogenase family protein [Ponticoccus sp. SC6-49]MBM1241695.1 aldehyde dehydrogenase family protein [Pontic
MEMFIDGTWQASDGGATFEVSNPATGAVVDHVPDATATDADRAIAAAARAFDTWRHRPVTERVAILKACAGAMRDRADEIGALLHAELGRPLAGCIGEISRSADLMDIYAEEGLRLQATMGLGGATGEKTIVTRDPVGVVVAITPFNYPVTLLLFKLGAALAAGCTMVAKPSEDTPLSTLRLAAIFAEAGLPPGCFNVVTGQGRALGEALVEHPVPRKIAFTGSTAVGKAIAAAAAGTMKRLTLELGGQSPAIVCADADLDKATSAIARHGFANSGQFCYRVNRVYVDRAIHDAFVAQLTDKVATLTLAPAGGDGDLGPLVNSKIYANSAAQVADARDKGARIVLGGDRQTGPGFDGGHYLPPTIIADATPDMLILREETFGPVLGICAVDSPAEALRLANDSRYGLAGFVFTRDLARGLALCEGMEAGSVWLNDIQRSSHFVPFGGMKESGLGREKGRYGVEAYLEYKTLYLSYEVPE